METGSTVLRLHKAAYQCQSSKIRHPKTFASIHIAKLVAEMPAAHKKFLVSFVRGKPNWIQIGLPGAANLPAVKWRQLNLDMLTPEKRAAEVAELEKVLSI